MGNCCILICGESNGVKYSRERRRVEDVFGLRRSLPSGTVILNPVHDRMIRFEMPLKRSFLSKNGRSDLVPHNFDSITKIESYVETRL